MGRDNYTRDNGNGDSSVAILQEPKDYKAGDLGTIVASTSTEGNGSKNGGNGTAHNDPNVALYFKKSSKIKLLTREDEVELGKRIKKGDETAVKELVEANIRYVVKVANKYKGCGLPLPDLVNEGNIGLILAAKKFDYERGVRFITYADWWIRQGIRVALANQTGQIRLPLNKVILYDQIQKVIKELEQKNGYNPPLDVLTNEVNLKLKIKSSPEVVEIILMAREPHLPLDGLIEGGRSTIGDAFPDKNSPPLYQGLEAKCLSKEIEGLLSRLPAKEEKVIRMRYGLNGNRGPMTLEEVGKVFGLSRERVRQIEKRAKKRLGMWAKPELANYLH